jgi:hypothetical protein
VSKLLIPEPPLQVLRTLAVRIGLNEAIVLQQLHYWSQRSKDDGWVEKTYDDWREQDFTFWGIATVKRTFASLRALGLVVNERAAGNLERTQRYRVDYEAVDELAREDQSDPPERIKLIRSTGSKRSARKDQIDPLGSSIGSKTEEATAETTTAEPAVTAEVFAVLTSVAARKRCATPGRAAVARAIAEFPNFDHLAVAKDLEFWALHGKGQRRQSMAIAQTYRNFLKRAEPRPATTSSQPRSAYDQPAN